MGKRVHTNFKQRPHHFIREWRKSKNWTQERLAGMVEMSASSISQLENGEQGYSQETLERLAHVFNCRPGDLLMRDPLDKGAPWSVADALKPANKAKVIEYIKLLADAEKREDAA